MEQLPAARFAFMRSKLARRSIVCLAAAAGACVAVLVLMVGFVSETNELSAKAQAYAANIPKVIAVGAKVDVGSVPENVSVDVDNDAILEVEVSDPEPMDAGPVTPDYTSIESTDVASTNASTDTSTSASGNSKYALVQIDEEPDGSEGSDNTDEQSDSAIEDDDPASAGTTNEEYLDAGSSEGDDDAAATYVSSAGDGDDGSTDGAEGEQESDERPQPQLSVTAKARGETTVSFSSGEQTLATARVQLSNPTLETETVTLDRSANEDECMVKVNGLLDESSIAGGQTSDGDALASSVPEVATATWDNGALHVVAGTSAGTTVISLEIDYLELNLSVTTTGYRFEKSDKDLTGEGNERGALVMYEGETTALSLVGASADETTWTSSDASVATVDASGTVTATGCGSANINVAIHDETAFTYDICVGTEQGVKACRWAVEKTPATYSQDRRMEEGFFDCSSLTGRAYASAGFASWGSESSPTAADQASWCAASSHVVSYGGTSQSNVIPGDLIFYCTAYAGVNDRFSHIDHVVLYLGDGKKVEVEDGIEDVSTDSSSVVMIGRPTQTSKATPEKVSGLKVVLDKDKTSQESAAAVSHSATLTWGSACASTYEVYRSENGGEYKRIASVSGVTETYTDEGLACDTTYRYKVRVYVGSSYGGFSEVKSITTPVEAVQQIEEATQTDAQAESQADGEQKDDTAAQPDTQTNTQTTE